MTTRNGKQSITSDKGDKPKIKRSRNGCHNCKRLKIKCNEAKPSCYYCIKTDTKCDYSMKLTWGGRPYKNNTKQKKLLSTSDADSEDVTKNMTLSSRRPGNDIQFVVEGGGKKYSDTTGKRSRNTSLSSISPNIENPSKKPKINSAVVTNTEENTNGAGSSNDSNTKQPSAPSSFATPSGDSILSSFNTYTQNGSLDSLNGNSYLYSGLTPTDNRNIMAGIKSIESAGSADKISSPIVKTEMPKDETLTSVIDNLPDISYGIESVSNEVERISNGEYHLNLKNSGILNNFVLSNLEDNITLIDKDTQSNGTPKKIEPIEKNPSLWSPVSDINLDGFDCKINSRLPRVQLFDDPFTDYSTDLAKIESYLPERQKSNLLSDILSPSYSTNLFAYNVGSRKRIVEIDDNDDDDEEEEEEEQVSQQKNPFYGVRIDGNIDDLEISSVESEDIMIKSKLFESIPPLLVPLPEILLEVPFYRNLMHFWVNVASENLVPAPSYIYSDNPFKVLLPQMAMEYPSILTTLLAFAASMRSLLIGPEMVPKEVVNQLLARSCNELLRLLKDKQKATSDGALATVLLLSCYESVLSNDFDKHRTHALGARQIVMARHGLLSCTSPGSDKSSPSSTSSGQSSKQSSRRKESDIAFFLMRWFIYVDVMGALSATKNSHKYLTSEDGNYEPIESVTSLSDFDEASDIDRKNDIDHLLGFDIRVLPQLTDVALLIRQADTYFAQFGTQNVLLPITVITRALEIKESITAAYEIGEVRRQEKLDSIIDYKIQHKRETQHTDSPPNLTNIMQQYNILRATNKIFCDMGILNLYRRVLRVPRESPIVQSLADGIGLTLELNIESKSSAEICSIFCLFCAGCETLNPHMRSLFHDRFTKLTEMGNSNAKKSLQIMARCWETGEDWIVASSNLDIDIALL